MYKFRHVPDAGPISAYCFCKRDAAHSCNDATNVHFPDTYMNIPVNRLFSLVPLIYKYIITKLTFTERLVQVYFTFCELMRV